MQEASDAKQKSMEHLVGVLDSCSREKEAIEKRGWRSWNRS
jgi:hypothetical protein